MADIAAADVVYTQQSKDINDKYREYVFKVEFGDGSDTYPAGGVPLTKASLGCPNEIRSLHILDASDADGYVYKYDFENNKVRIYLGNNDQTEDGPLVEFTGASTVVAATDLYLRVIGY